MKYVVVTKFILEELEKPLLGGIYLYSTPSKCTGGKCTVPKNNHQS